MEFSRSCAAAAAVRLLLLSRRASSASSCAQRILHSHGLPKLSASRNTTRFFLNASAPFLAAEAAASSAAARARSSSSCSSCNSRGKSETKNEYCSTRHYGWSRKSWYGTAHISVHSAPDTVSTCPSLRALRGRTRKSEHKIPLPSKRESPCYPE